VRGRRQGEARRRRRACGGNEASTPQPPMLFSVRVPGFYSHTHYTCTENIHAQQRYRGIRRDGLHVLMSPAFEAQSHRFLFLSIRNTSCSRDLSSSWPPSLLRAMPCTSFPPSLSTTPIMRSAADTRLVFVSYGLRGGRGREARSKSVVNNRRGLPTLPHSFPLLL